MNQPIERACFWLARRTRELSEPLAHDRTADVAIVGAGLTGLWTALWLKRLDPAVDVAIVEQGCAGYGASGRNAGMLTESIDHDHALAIQHFGEPEARRLAAVGRANLGELEVELRDIACDYEPNGQLWVALDAAQLEDCRATVETAERLGLDGYRLLDAAETQAALASPLYHGAVAVARGGVLDPVGLVTGLRQRAEALGVRVYERSPVRALARVPAGVRIDCEQARLTGRTAVLATNAYGHRLVPALSRWSLPLYDYILVSEPLSPAERAAIGWRGRQGVADGRTFFNYYRLTADDRILWGTSEAAYHAPNRVEPALDHSPAHYQALAASFARHFPALSSLAFPYAWGGPISATTRMTPLFGHALGGRLHYALGYTGHGLATTHLAGKLLAHRVLARTTELDELALVRHKPLPYPPEPLRRWAVAAVTRGLRRVDGGAPPGLLLRVLERLGIGFSS